MNDEQQLESLALVEGMEQNEYEEMVGAWEDERLQVEWDELRAGMEEVGW